MTFDLSDEEIAFLAGVMSVQGSFTRTGGAASRIGWIVGARHSPQTITRIAELTGERVRSLKRGDIVVVAGEKLTELMEILSEWLDPDRYDQYLQALETTAEVVRQRKLAHKKKVAEREARVREMRLWTAERRRKLAEETYYNQDPAIQVIEDNSVVEFEVQRAIARRQSLAKQQQDMMRSPL